MDEGAEGDEEDVTEHKSLAHKSKKSHKKFKKSTNMKHLSPK